MIAAGLGAAEAERASAAAEEVGVALGRLVLDPGAEAGPVIRCTSR